MEKPTPYHEVGLGKVCELFKGFVGRVVDLGVDWDIKEPEAPLDPPVEPVTSLPVQSYEG